MKESYVTYYNCANNPDVGQFCLFCSDEPHHTLSGAISLEELKATYPETEIVLINGVHPQYFGTNVDTLLSNGGILV